MSNSYASRHPGFENTIVTNPDIDPALKSCYLLVGGRLCSFSSCIEQVQRMCLRLTELGFTDIRTMECLLRQFEVGAFIVVSVLGF